MTAEIENGMNITKNQIDNLNATIKIELGREDYAERVEKSLKDYQKKTVIRGFRQGKTPLGIIRKLYGKSVLLDEINRIVAESLGNYIKDNDLKILGEPLPDETERKELDLDGENFEFVFDIALSPEMNAGISSEDEIPYYTIRVDDEMVDRQIEIICRNNGKLVPVDEIEGSEYLKGVLTELDENGNEKENGIRNEEASMSVAHMKDEEAANAFKGRKVGEKVVFNAAKAYPNRSDFAAMLGVKREECGNVGENFSFVINSIERYVSAEPGEELFDRLYGKDTVKDVAGFRERVKADIERELKGLSEERFAFDAREKLVGKNRDVMLPEAFLKRWIVEKNEKMTPEEVDKDFEIYRNEFKWQLVKSSLQKEYDVKVVQEDLQKEGRLVAAAQLQQYGLYGLADGQLDGFAKKLLENQNQREHLYERALDRKILETIRENVKLVEQEISMDDFEKLSGK